MRAPTIFLAAALTLMSVAPLTAQRRPGRTEGDRAALEDRVRARMAETIRKRLGLSEQTARELGDVVRRFEGERRSLREEDRALRERVDVFLEGGAGDDRQAATLVRDLTLLHEREAALFTREQNAMLEVLTPTQLLQLHQARMELNQRVRALRDRRGGAGRGPGGPEGRGDPAGHGVRTPPH